MKRFYIFLIMLLVTGTAFSQTTTWTNGLNNNRWDLAGNWSNGVPTNNANVTIPANISVVIVNVLASGNINLNTLRIQGNSTITFQNASASRTMTIGNGTNANDLWIESGSSLTLSGAAGANGVNIGLIDNSTGVTNGVIDGVLTVEGNRIFDADDLNTLTTVNGTIDNESTVTGVAGRLVFSASGTYLHSRNGGVIPAATWTTGSKMQMPGTTNTLPTGLNQTFSDVVFSGNIGNNDLTLASNFTARDLTISNTVGTGSLILTSDNSTRTLIVNRNFSMTSGLLVMQASTGTANIDVAGNFSQSGGIIDFVAGTSITNGVKSYVNVGGNLSQTGGTMTRSNFTYNMGSGAAAINGTFIFDGGGVQTFSTYDPTQLIYINYTINSGSTLKLLSNMGLSRNFVDDRSGTLLVNGTFDASTFVVSSQITATADPVNAFAVFTLASGGKLITANPGGVSASINAASTNFNRSFSSVADYEFQSTSTGVFTTTPTASTARNFIVNNTTGNLTLSQPMAVTGTLTLTDGELNTTATNIITINAGAGTTTATNNSFVNGPVRKIGTTAFTFPVGRSGAGYVPVSISAAGASNTLTAEYFRGVPPNNQNISAPSIFQISACDYWSVTRSAGISTNINVTFNWNANSPCSGAYITNPTTVRAVRYNGTNNWSSASTAPGTGVAGVGSVTWTGVTTFNLFALGSTSSNENPLPVLFADVKAYGKNNGVQVEWSNLTEREILYYSVQRSSNGTDFSEIEKYLPKSNLDDKASYAHFDPTPASGINYYRIKVYEKNGKIIYSKVLRVELGSVKTGLSLYPNPVTGNQLTISLTGVAQGKYSLRVVNTSGQDVYRATLNNVGSGITEMIILPGSVKPGVYTTVVTGPNFTENKMFIVR